MRTLVHYLTRGGTYGEEAEAEAAAEWLIDVAVEKAVEKIKHEMAVRARDLGVRK